MTGSPHPVIRHARARPPVGAALLLALLAGSCKDASGPGSGNFTVTPPTAALLVGEGVQLTAVGAPGKVAWSSTNSQIASVIPETGFTRGIGRGQATVTAVSGSASASAVITVTVPPSLRLSRATAEFEAGVDETDPAPVTVLADNAGDGAINSVAAGAVQYAQGQRTGWLGVSPAGSSAAPVTFTLQPRTQGMPAGTYGAVVSIHASDVQNSPQNVAVTFRVLSPPSIVLSRTSVPMAGIPGAAIEETVSVTNGGDRPLTGLTTTITYAAGQPQGWLAAAVGGTAPATLTLTANTAGLAVGNYKATVRVASSLNGVAPRDVAVDLTVNPGPAIQLSRTAVAVNATNGVNAGPQTVSITNGGGGSLTGLATGSITWGQGQPTGWVTPALDQTTAPATLTLTFSSAALPQGTYTAVIPVQSPVASNSPLNVTVTLVVGPPPSISLLPAAVAFSTFRGASILPNAQAVLVNNGGGGTLSGLSYAIQYQSGSNWLGAQWQNGTTTAPAALILQPVTAALVEGTYTAKITISSTLAGVAAKTVDVTYVIQSFTLNVLPTFQSANPLLGNQACAGCHFSGGQWPYMNQSAPTVWQNLQGYIVPGNENAGLLVCKITSNAACPSAMPMPASWVAIIKAWIKAGAPYQ